MAEFKGFGFKSPTDVVAETQAGFQRAFTSGDKDAMRAATVSNAAFTLFGSPELNKAKRREKLLVEAFENAEESSTGDEVEDELNFYRNAQKAAIEAGLPEIALQATDKQAQLRLVQEERARLKQQSTIQSEENKRAEEAHKESLQKARRDNAFDTTALIVNTATDEVVREVDLTDPNAQAIIRANTGEGTGNTLIDMATYSEVTQAERDRQNRLKRMRDAGGQDIAGRSGVYGKYFETLQNTSNFNVSANRMVDLLLDPEASATFAVGGQGAGILEQVGVQARSLLNLANPGVDLEADISARFEKNERFNALDSERKAMVMELGFALATAREGGRLTDQDVDRAITSLGIDNPDPRAVAYTFGRALKDRRTQIDRSLNVSGVKDVPQVQEGHAQVLEDLDATIERLESVYQLDFSKDTIDEALGRERSTQDSVEDIREVSEKDNDVVVVPTSIKPIGD
jgi:hypothetical protein